MPKLTDFLEQELEPGDIFLYASNSRDNNLRVGIFISCDKLNKLDANVCRVKAFFVYSDWHYSNFNSTLGILNEIDSVTFKTKAFKLVHPEFYINQAIIQRAYQAIDVHQELFKNHD